jgi:hypothetical protein
MTGAGSIPRSSVNTTPKGVAKEGFSLLVKDPSQEGAMTAEAVLREWRNRKVLSR